MLLFSVLVLSTSLLTASKLESRNVVTSLNDIASYIVSMPISFELQLTDMNCKNNASDKSDLSSEFGVYLMVSHIELKIISSDSSILDKLKNSTFLTYDDIRQNSGILEHCLSILDRDICEESIKKLCKNPNLEFTYIVNYVRKHHNNNIQYGYRITIRNHLGPESAIAYFQLN